MVLSKNLLFLILIPIIFPISYIFGSFSINFTIILSIIFLIILKKKIKSEIINFKLFFIFFFFLVLFFFFNSLYSSYFQYSFFKSFSYLRFFIFFLFFVLVLDTLDKNQKKNISIFFLILTILVGLDTLFQFFFGYDIFGKKAFTEYSRLTGPFSEEIVGHFLLNFGILSLALFSFYHQIGNFFKFSFIVFIIFLIFLTGERNSFYSSVILFIFLAIFCNKNRLLSVLILITVFILFYTSTKIFKVQSHKYTLEAIQTVNDPKLNDNKIIIPKKLNKFEKFQFILSNNQWFMHFNAATQIFISNKIIGSGFKTFRYECLELDTANKKILCSTHPHNIYFEIISDLGFLGFIIFFVMIFFFIFYFFRKKVYRSYEKSIMVGLFFVYIFPFKPHGSLFSTNFASLLFFLASVSYYYIFHNEKK